MLDLKSIVLVFLGGGIGSSIRYIITKYSTKNYISFPLGTSISNLIGCLIIGLLIAYYDKNDIPKSDTFIFVSMGFCGGLTTFSSLMLDILYLIKSENFLYLLTYLSLNFIVGFFFVYIGFLIFRWFRYFYKIINFDIKNLSMSKKLQCRNYILRNS